MKIKPLLNFLKISTLVFVICFTIKSCFVSQRDWHITKIKSLEIKECYLAFSGWDFLVATNGNYSIEYTGQNQIRICRK